MTQKRQPGAFRGNELSQCRRSTANYRDDVISGLDPVPMELWLIVIVLLLPPRLAIFKQVNENAEISNTSLQHYIS